VLNGLVAVTLGRRKMAASHARASIEEQRRAPTSYEPPAKVARRARVRPIETLTGWPCYELALPGVEPLVDLVHLHGGSYISELSARHWHWAVRLAADLPARVLLPVYPLASSATADVVVAGAVTEVGALIDGAARPVVLSGDSAGGGLALATALGLRDDGRALPDHLAVQAPWLDLGLRHPGIAAQEPLDHVLSLDYLRAAAAEYAGDLSYDDPRVSPIQADLHGLPPITIHVGSRDLGLPDALDFAERARAAEVPIDLHVVPDQIHGYWVLPLPEAKQLRRDLGEVTRRLSPPAG
jgi:acetyl esterase/lipase